MEQEQISPESLDILRTRGMRYGALALCLLGLLTAFNALTRVPQPKPFGVFRNSELFSPAVAPFSFVLSIAVYGYFAWAGVTLARASKAFYERILIWAFIGSLLLSAIQSIPESRVIQAARYAEIALWTIATLFTAKLLVACNSFPEAEHADSPSSRGLASTALLYVEETLMATAGVMAVVAVALRLLYPAAHMLLPALTAESFNQLMFMPSSTLEIGVGALSGYIAARQFRSRVALYVWIPSLLIVLFYVATYSPSSVLEPRWTSLATRLFGPACRPPQCYVQSFLTIPLCSSVAFSFGAWLWLRVKRIATNST